MPEMTDNELLGLVEGEFESAMGSPGGEISQERADAYDYYLSKPLGNEIEGQSQVVTSDVADVVDGIMPSLLRIFTVSENLIDFDPVGSEDIAQAQQESDYVNHVFFKQNPSFLIFYQWFFDALVQKNGIVKAWWDDSEEVTTESYVGLNEQELAELMDDDELEPIEQEEREIELDPNIAAATGYEEQAIQSLQEQMAAAMEGEQTEATVTVHDVTFRRTSEKGSPRIAPVPPEEFRISADAHSLDPSEARMVGQERDVPRSDLLEMGFDKDIVNELPSNQGVHDSEEEISRYSKSDEDNQGFYDHSQEMIEVKEAYVRVDYDGDGRSELRQIIIAGGQILSNEEADRQPFHVISPQPLPHKHFGRASAEKVMDVQKISTTLNRQILDNLYHTNNPEHGVWEQGIGDNTLDDLLTRRAGSVNRFARPVNESWAPMNVPFTAGESFPMLEYWDRVKRDRTGVNADGEGLNPEQLKNIQSSVLAQANDLSRMKIEAIVRIFAETGVKSLFRHIHELLLKHQRKEETVLLRNEWVSVNPQEWRTRNNMTIRVGLGVGTKEQNLIHLNEIWDKQTQAIDAGGFGTLVSGENVYNTAIEIVKNANLKNPEKFFTDPSTVEQEQGPSQQDQATMAQLQIQKQQMDNDARENEIRREQNLLHHKREMLKIAREQAEHSDEMAHKAEELANELTEMDLKYQGTDVPGSRTEGDGQ